MSDKDAKLIRIHRETFVGPVQEAPDECEPPKKDPLGWTAEFALSQEEVDAIAEPEKIDEFIVQGHVVALIGKSNGGKTTIMEHLAGEWAAKGYRVIYVDADIAATDAKRKIAKAQRHGFEVILPDMKLGKSMADVVKIMDRMAAGPGDFTGVVLICDTLKKMTDVINKTAAKRLYKTLRALSAKGMTVIVLGHTNKYDGPDGKPIYEGTGDLRADVDELLYLISTKNSDGSMTVSIEPDKVRAVIKPVTFEISANRRVRRVEEYVDLRAIEQQEEQQAKDSYAIDAILDAMEAGNGKQVDITTFCRKEHEVSKRTCLKVLARYTDVFWRCEKGFAKNAKNYAPLGSGKTGKTEGRNDEF